MEENTSSCEEVKSIQKKERRGESIATADSPYFHAKQVQMIDKDLEASITLFRNAIYAGDRVESALKDMATVMRQLDRSEEAIEAIKSFRDRCSEQSQESLDNILIELYKKCGNVEEQIALLKYKLQKIYKGEAFNGKMTKRAHSHGKKIRVHVKKVTSRIMANLGWAFMQQGNYGAAEVVLRKAHIIDPDAKKAWNLGQCLMKQARYEEARFYVKDILQRRLAGSNDCKTKERAQELLQEIEWQQPSWLSLTSSLLFDLEGLLIEELEKLMNARIQFRSRRLPIFEEISQFQDQLS